MLHPYRGLQVSPGVSAAAACTFDPLYPVLGATLNQASPGAGITISAPTRYTHRVQSTSGASSSFYQSWLSVSDGNGLRYIEFVNQGAGDGFQNTGRGVVVGFATATGTPNGNPNGSSPMGAITNLNYQTVSPGYVVNGGSFTTNSSYDFLQNDVICMAIDHSTNKLWIRKNGGAWIGGGDPAAGTLPTFTLTGGAVSPYISAYTRNLYACDFQVRMLLASDTFNYSAPAGFSPYTDSTATASTVLLLHLDGTNGSTTFVDSSAYAKTTAAVAGSVSLDTSQKVFGASSASFTGGYFQFPDSIDWHFAGADFTVEMNARFNSASVAQRVYLIGQADNIGGDCPWSISKDTNDKLVAAGSGGVAFAMTSTLTVSPNVWYHIALVRNGSSMVLYVNGSAWASTTVSGSFVDKTYLLGIGIIGQYSAGTYGGTFGTKMMGWLDEVRITKGNARYTASFTPPALAYCNGTSGVVSAPSPQPSPSPPVNPPSFIVSAVPSVDVTIATLISPAKSLAAITTATTGVVLSATGVPAGCTVSLTGSPATGLLLNGTPTTAGSYTIDVNYLTSAGMVIGASRHVVNVLDPAALFVGGSCVNFSGRVGIAADVTLATPSLPQNAYVTATFNAGVPGMATSLAWTPAATSTGVLRIYGTPTSSLSSTTLTVSYYIGTRLIGTTVHTLQVSEAYNPPPAPPAPSPAPPAPAPAPAPSPPSSPAPPPIPAADTLLSSVKWLHRFNLADRTSSSQSFVEYVSAASAPGLFTVSRPVISVVEARPVRGSEYIQFGEYLGGWLISSTTLQASDLGSISYTTPYKITYTSSVVTGFSATIGPSLLGDAGIDMLGLAGESSSFASGQKLLASTQAGWSTQPTNLCVEGMVRLAAPAVLASGSGLRFMPVVSLTDPSVGLIWALGIGGGRWAPGSVDSSLQGVFVVRTSAGTYAAVASQQYSGSLAGNMPYYHLAGQLSAAAMACWWGRAGQAAAAVTIASSAVGSTLQVGGQVPAFSSSLGQVQPVSFAGQLDELRITEAARYTPPAVGGTNVIPSSSIQLPWPNY